MYTDMESPLQSLILMQENLGIFESDEVSTLRWALTQELGHRVLKPHKIYTELVALRCYENSKNFISMGVLSVYMHTGRRQKISGDCSYEWL